MDERKEMRAVSAAEEARLRALAALLPEGRPGLLCWPEETGSTNAALRVLADVLR